MDNKIPIDNIVTSQRYATIGSTPSNRLPPRHNPPLLHPEQLEEASFRPPAHLLGLGDAPACCL